MRPVVASFVCAGLIVCTHAGVTARQAGPPKPLVPAAASSIALNPDAYIGQFVTVMAAVDAIVAPTAFTLDQDRTRTADPILVVAPLLSGPVTINAYVTVMGEVIRFDADEITRRTKIQLPQDVADAQRGRPVIVATSVLDAALVDLAKRLPPPVTPEEEAFDRIMKRVNPAFAAVRQAVADSNADVVKTQAAILKQTFGETESFWKLRAKPDAMKWAADARRQAEALEHAATTADWDAAKAATAGIQQSCSSCHAAYRERFDDGSYRIRGEK